MSLKGSQYKNKNNSTNQPSKYIRSERSPHCQTHSPQHAPNSNVSRWQHIVLANTNRRKKKTKCNKQQMHDHNDRESIEHRASILVSGQTLWLRSNAFVYRIQCLLCIWVELKCFVCSEKVINTKIYIVIVVADMTAIATNRLQHTRAMQREERKISKIGCSWEQRSIPREAEREIEKRMEGEKKK